MFVPRFILPTLKQVLQQFSVVLLTGPRQCGKTELLCHEFSELPFFSLDALDTRQKADKDPRSFFSKGFPLIIDEIQEAPELLTYIKEVVDQRRTPGQILLTGSHQFHLMRGVTQSLAGRVAILHLLPFSYQELRHDFSQSLSELLHRGMYPQVQTTPDLNLDLWFSSYINTYLERDLRAQVAIHDLRAFEAFLQLLAARIGKELNIHRLSKDLGVSSATLKAWISALEASYILYLLPPYYENLGKRVIKSPKIYFLDTGLVCYLTNLRHAEEILAGPLGGPLFENFVVCELVKKYYFAGKKAPLYFWRSHDGLEVDIILDHGLRLEALECKLTQTITDRHVPNLLEFRKLEERLVNRKKLELSVVSCSEKPALSGEIRHYHWKEVGS